MSPGSPTSSFVSKGAWALRPLTILQFASQPGIVKQLTDGSSPVATCQQAQNYQLLPTDKWESHQHQRSSCSGNVRAHTGPYDLRPLSRTFPEHPGKNQDRFIWLVGPETGRAVGSSLSTPYSLQLRKRYQASHRFLRLTD